MKKLTNLAVNSGASANPSQVVKNNILEVLRELKESAEYKQLEDPSSTFDISLSVKDDYIMILKNSHNFVNKKIYRLIFLMKKSDSESTFLCYALIEKIKYDLDFFIKNNMLEFEVEHVPYIVGDHMENGFKKLFNSEFINFYQTHKIESDGFKNVDKVLQINEFMEGNNKLRQLFEADIDSNVLIFVNLQKIEKFNFYHIYSYMNHNKGSLMHIIFYIPGSGTKHVDINMNQEIDKINLELKYFKLVEDFNSDKLILYLIKDFHKFDQNFSKFNLKEKTMENTNTIYLMDINFQIIEIFDQFVDFQMTNSEFPRNSTKPNKISSQNILLYKDSLKSFNENDQKVNLLAEEEENQHEHKPLDMSLNMNNDSIVENLDKNIIGSGNYNYYNNSNSGNPIPIEKSNYKKIKNHIKSFKSRHSLKDFKPKHFLEFNIKKRLIFNSNSLEVDKKYIETLIFFYSIGKNYMPYLKYFWNYLKKEKLEGYIATKGCILNYKYFINKFIERLKSEYTHFPSNFFNLNVDYQVNYNYNKNSVVKKLIIENSNSSRYDPNSNQSQTEIGLGSLISNNSLNAKIFNEVKKDFTEILMNSGYNLQINLKMFPKLQVGNQFLFFNKKLKTVNSKFFEGENSSNNKVLVSLIIVLRLDKVFTLDMQFFEFMKLVNSDNFNSKIQVVIITLGDQSTHEILLNSYSDSFSHFPHIKFHNLKFPKMFKYFLYSLYDLKNFSINSYSSEVKNFPYSIFLVSNQNGKILSKSHNFFDNYLNNLNYTETTPPLNTRYSHINLNRLRSNADLENLFTENTLDNFKITFKQLKIGIKNIRDTIETRLKLINKCKYDFTLKVNIRYDKHYKLSDKSIHKPELFLQVHEYDVPIISTILNEILFSLVEKNNFKITLNGKLKNQFIERDMGSQSKLVYTNLKGQKKGYLIGNLLGESVEENKNCCSSCEQCLIF